MAFFATKGCTTWSVPGGTSSFMPRWSSEDSRGLTSVVRKRWSTPLAAMREIDWLIRGPWEVVPVSSGNRDRGALISMAMKSTRFSWSNSDFKKSCWRGV